MCCFNNTKQKKKNLLLLFTKDQPVGLWLIVHVTTKFFNNYLRVLMSKLGWMVSILVNYVTYISMEKNENNEYEIECSSNLVEL